MGRIERAQRSYLGRQDMCGRKQFVGVAFLASVFLGGLMPGAALWAEFPAPPAASLPVGMVSIDRVLVPDIGPLPTVVPMPGTNLTYKDKVELGKQLYFDGRLSKNGQVPCAFCHLPAVGFADPRQT